MMNRLEANENQNSKNYKPTTNMEVHHHPHVEKKTFKEYFFGNAQ